MKLKTVDREHFKITVEEVSERRKNGMVVTHITTFWNKNDCEEVDRSVFEFETFGGAVDKALDLLDIETGGGL